jgi:hypothetical protein
MAMLKRRRTPAGQFFYDLRYRVGEYALRGFIACLPYVPFSVVERFTYLAAWLSFKLLAQYRRRMAENALTLGKQITSEAERKVGLTRLEKLRRACSIPQRLCTFEERIIATVLQGEAFRAHWPRQRRSGSERHGQPP